MTRAEKRQENRAQEDELKRKKFEVQGFTFSTQKYHKKRNIANRKSSCKTPEEEKLERQATADAALKVYRRTLPILLKRLSKINDPREPKKIKHSLTVLMLSLIHISEPTRLGMISYAVFCLKKKKKKNK